MPRLINSVQAKYALKAQKRKCIAANVDALNEDPLVDAPMQQYTSHPVTRLATAKRRASPAAKNIVGARMGALARLKNCVDVFVALCSSESTLSKLYDVHDPNWFDIGVKYPASALGKSGIPMKAMWIAAQQKFCVDWTPPDTSCGIWSHLHSLRGIEDFVLDTRRGHASLPANHWLLAAVLTGIVIKFETNESSYIYEVLATLSIAASIAGDDEDYEAIVRHWNRSDVTQYNRTVEIMKLLERSVLFETCTRRNIMLVMDIFTLERECPWEDTVMACQNKLLSITIKSGSATHTHVLYYGQTITTLILNVLNDKCASLLYGWCTHNCRCVFIEYIAQIATYAVVQTTPECTPYTIITGTSVEAQNLERYIGCVLTGLWAHALSTRHRRLLDIVGGKCQSYFDISFLVSQLKAVETGVLTHLKQLDAQRAIICAQHATIKFVSAYNHVN